MKRFFSHIVSLCAFLCIALVSVQASPGYGFNRRMRKVRELMKQELYVAADREIGKIRAEGLEMNEQDRAGLDGCSLLCSIALDKKNVEALIGEFENRHHDTPELIRAKFLYSSRCFSRKDYAGAMKYMDQVEYSFLSREEKMDFLFNRSFCQLKFGQIEDSRSGFTELAKMSSGRYAVSSVYYLGYIAYLDRDFSRAVSHLSEVEQDDRYGTFAGYFLLESHLMLKDYDYVTEKGSEVIGSVDPSMRAKVARIVSEAYFEQNRPEEAKKWFDDYSSSGAELTRKDNYYSGVISYSLHAYYAAIDAFQKVVVKNDSLTQSALYHMGNSYLNLKNKHEAYEAFRKASEMLYDESIREEALFNHAKLSFDLNDDMTAFGRYLDLYPASDRKDEIYAYMAASSLLSKQYQEAIDALGQIRYPTPEITLNLQKAAFFRGMELFEKGAYSDASAAYRISLDHSSYNASLMLLTRFWLAEAKYRTNDFQGAARIQQQLYENSRFREMKEYPLLLFSLGYSYFRLEKYPESIACFNRFLDQHDSGMDQILEARIRLADAYFSLKDYKKSSSVYEEVSIVNYDSETIVYAAYQAAVSYGLLGNYEKKCSILESIYGKAEKSPFYNGAVYELGRTYMQMQENEKAEKLFRYLIDDIGDPLFNSRSLLELGMLYSNMGEYEKAVSTLKEIVSGTPLSPEVPNALAVMESIYTLQNHPEEYLAYLDSAGLSETKNAADREKMMFNSAEQIFLSGDNKTEANRALSAFLKKYPDGEWATQAYFYLGETLLGLGKKEEAAQAYQKVMQTGEGSFVELSTMHYADICYGMEQYDRAAAAYQSLLQVARLENNRHLAQLGILRSSFRGGSYQAAVEAAQELLKTEKGAAENRQEAEYVLAKSYIALGKREEALPILKSLSQLNITPEGAEATYLLIQDVYDSGNFTEVENQVYAFSESDSDQTYWIARAFIVLGDSFAEREEWEQAKATFQSIKEGYRPVGKKDDVLDQVAMRLARIEKLTANQQEVQ